MIYLHTVVLSYLLHVEMDFQKATKLGSNDTTMHLRHASLFHLPFSNLALRVFFILESESISNCCVCVLRFGNDFVHTWVNTYVVDTYFQVVERM